MDKANHTRRSVQSSVLAMTLCKAFGKAINNLINTIKYTESVLWKLYHSTIFLEDGVIVEKFIGDKWKKYVTNDGEDALTDLESDLKNSLYIPSSILRTNIPRKNWWC